MTVKLIQALLLISIAALSGACRTYSITGKIICTDHKPLAGVECRLYKTSLQRSNIVLTDSSGVFHFQRLYRYKKYNLKFLYAGSLTGISVYDMVLQSKVMLVFRGQLLNRDSSFHLWHLLAADANQDNKTDVDDNVTLKSWIESPSKKQFPPWLFLPVEKAFLKMPAYPEMPNVTDNVFVFKRPQESCIYLDLVGIKIGDLNSTGCSWP